MHDDVWAHQCRCGWSVRVPTLALLQFRVAEHQAAHDEADRIADSARDLVGVDLLAWQRDVLARIVPAYQTALGL